MKLLNSKQLAEDLGVSTWFTKALKLAAAEYGDSPFMGRYTTRAKVDAWLNSHPDFVPQHWHAKAAV